MIGDPSAQVGEVKLGDDSPYYRQAQAAIELTLPHLVTKDLQLEDYELATKALANILDGLRVLNTLDRERRMPTADVVTDVRAADNMNETLPHSVVGNGYAVDVSSHLLDRDLGSVTDKAGKVIERHPSADADQNGHDGSETSRLTDPSSLVWGLGVSNSYDLPAFPVVERSQVASADIAVGLESSESSAVLGPDVIEASRAVAEIVDTSADSIAVDEPDSHGEVSSPVASPMTELPVKTPDDKETPTPRLAPTRTVTFDRPSRTNPKPEILVMGGNKVRVHNPQVASVLRIMAANPNRRMRKKEILDEGFGNPDESVINREIRLDHAVAELRRSRNTGKLGIKIDDSRSIPRIIYTPDESTSAKAEDTFLGISKDDEPTEGGNSTTVPEAGVIEESVLPVRYEDASQLETTPPIKVVTMDRQTLTHKDMLLTEIGGMSVVAYNPHLSSLLSILALNPNLELDNQGFYEKGFGKDLTPKSRGVILSKQIQVLFADPELAERLGLSRPNPNRIIIIYRPADATGQGEAPIANPATEQDSLILESIEAVPDNASLWAHRIAADITKQGTWTPEDAEAFRKAAGDNLTTTLSTRTEDGWTTVVLHESLAQEEMAVGADVSIESNGHTQVVDGELLATDTDIDEISYDAALVLEAVITEGTETSGELVVDEQSTLGESLDDEHPFEDNVGTELDDEVTLMDQDDDTEMGGVGKEFETAAAKEVILSPEWGLGVRFEKDVPHFFLGGNELLWDTSFDTQAELCALLAAYFIRRAVGKVKLPSFVESVHVLLGDNPYMQKEPFDRVVGNLHRLKNLIGRTNSKLAQRISIKSTKIGKNKAGEFEIPGTLYRSAEEVREMLHNLKYSEAVINRFLLASE